MLWVNEIMPSLHPRRVAREGVLEALFANQFSDERPDLVLKRILDLNPDRKKKFRVYRTPLSLCYRECKIS